MNFIAAVVAGISSSSITNWSIGEHGYTAPSQQDVSLCVSFFARAAARNDRHNNDIMKIETYPKTKPYRSNADRHPDPRPPITILLPHSPLPYLNRFRVPRLHDVLPVHGLGALKILHLTVTLLWFSDITLIGGIVNDATNT